MRLSWIILAVLLITLVWGLDQIAVAPLETGDIYPQYSSLRSDPSGAKALYESLADIPGINVDRLYKERQTMHPGDVMFVLGVDPVPFSAVDEKTIGEYAALVSKGGRLLLAFLPLQTVRPSLDQHSLQKRWQVTIAARHSGDAAGLDAGPEWRVLSHGAIERSFGAGSIALAPDSFPLSNQGLRDARDAAFIAELIGPAHHVIFDEHHFGVIETGSVVKLMRQYRLEGAVAMMAIVAALFLWRSSSSLLPPRQVRSDAAVTGRESIEGLSALLHRGVKEKDLLDVCFAEWRKSARNDGRAACVEQEISATGKRDPVAAYRAASRVLSEKR